MSDKGFGWMINALSDSGEDTSKAVEKSIGKEIASIKLVEEDDGALRINFADGSQLTIWDDGRSCCESRYITSDDKLDDFVGSTLQNVQVKDAPEVSSEWGVHEVQFLVVTTSRGEFTCETHNEHNGYYGGFWMKARLAS